MHRGQLLGHNRVEGPQQIQLPAVIGRGVAQDGNLNVHKLRSFFGGHFGRAGPLRTAKYKLTRATNRATPIGVNRDLNLQLLPGALLLRGVAVGF